MKALIVAAVLTIGAISMAQGGGQGRGQGGGGRQGGMFGGRGGGGPAGLVNRADVQKDIKITDEQKKKLEEYQSKQREEQRARMEEMRNGGGGGGGGFDREAMQKMQAENQAKQEKAIKEILDEKQWNRVREIWVQLNGNRAILNAEVQAKLNLTDDQKAKIKELQAKQQEANQSVMEKMRNQEITREEMQEANKKNNDALSAELGKVLTEDQAKALKAMGGEPFKADDNGGGGN